MLRGKVALVTGAAKGLGREIAVSLAKGGVKVAVHYHRLSAEATLAAVRRHSDGFLVRGDVTNEKDVQRVIRTVVKKYDRLDIVVNNVGSFMYKPLATTSMKEFSEVIETNLHGTFLMAKEALQQMRKQKGGCIINMGSSGCERMQVRSNTMTYYIAKSGVLMLTKALAAEEGKNGVRVNMVSPGILETSIVKEKGPLTSTQDVVAAILFLLSEKAEGISGANIEVSSGWAPDIS